MCVPSHGSDTLLLSFRLSVQLETMLIPYFLQSYDSSLNQWPSNCPF